MKDKIFKFISIGAITLSIVINSVSAKAASSSSAMQVLNKYNTNEIIMLRDKPIEIPIYAQGQKEQFRGVWVSTVYNLDFPSKQGMNKEEYKAEYTKILDNLEALNMNAIIFQIRPELDAFYPSDINPWSKYLTGTQGVSPKWDPLEWMIKETHSRGMEFHAWFNPYRVTVSPDNNKTKEERLSELAPNNWARQNPEFVFSFNGKLQLNPGEPEVIKYINDSVMEIVENYDIDSVHFDDYFYPFKSGDNWYAKEEETAYYKYGYGMNRDDWRRNNVDNLVKTIHDSIEIYNNINNKKIQFGISPFGIWGHMEFHPEGSLEGVGSLTPRGSRASYDDQFADTRKWVKNNWIDYIVPQIYWTFDEKAAPYGELVNWWADVVRDTDVNLYIGHANYRKADISNKNISWQNPEEISNQLKFNNLYDEVKGSVFFRYKSLLEDENTTQANKEFIKILKEEHFRSKASLPSSNRLSHKEEVQSPYDLMVIRTSYGYILVWEDTPDNDSVVYRIYREELGEYEETEKILIREVTRGNYDRFVFIDKSANPIKEYLYSITAVNRENIESEPCILK